MWTDRISKWGGNANAVKRGSPGRLRRSTSSFNQWNPASRCALALPMNSSSRRCASCARPRSWSAIAFRATAKTQTASAPPLPTRLPAACRAGTSSKGSGCSVVLGRDLERPLQRGARLLEFCGGSVEIHVPESRLHYGGGLASRSEAHDAGGNRSLARCGCAPDPSQTRSCEVAGNPRRADGQHRRAAHDQGARASSVKPSIARGHADRMLAVGKVAQCRSAVSSRRRTSSGTARPSCGSSASAHTSAAASPLCSAGGLLCSTVSSSASAIVPRRGSARPRRTMLPHLAHPAGAWSPRPGSSTRSRCARRGCPAPRYLRPRREDPERASGSPR